MDQMETTQFDQREDKVRAQSKPEANQRIDEKTAYNLRLYAAADKDLISSRLEQLDREWDIERILQVNASGAVLVGMTLGLLVNRKWLALPVIVGGFLLQHAVQGWCPPLVLLRSKGVRTRKEIERERYGLKLLRGDFDSFHSGEKPDIRHILSLVDSSTIRT